MGLILKPRVGRRINFTHPLAKGLAGCWMMHEGSGNKVYDLSENGLVGTFATSGSLPTWSDNGVDFAASANERIDLGSKTDIINKTRPHTIAAKVRLDAFTNSYPGICRLDYSIENFEFFFSNNASYRDVAIGVNSAFWGRFRTGDIGIQTGQIYSVATTYNGKDGTVVANHRIYVDGVSKALSNTGGGFASDSATSAIGIEGSNEWNGLIWYLYLWNRELSVNEIAWLHHEPYAMFEYPELWEYYVAAAVGATMAGHYYRTLMQGTGY